MSDHLLTDSLILREFVSLLAREFSFSRTAIAEDGILGERTIRLPFNEFMDEQLQLSLDDYSTFFLVGAVRKFRFLLSRHKVVCFHELPVSEESMRCTIQGVSINFSSTLLCFEAGILVQTQRSTING